MAITHLSKRYSRGNDDQSENQFETALVEVTLTLNTDECETVGGRCKGTVVPSLSYRATASTDEQIFAQGTGLRLLDAGAGAGGASANLTFTLGPVPLGPGLTPPPSIRGSTLTALIDLPVLGCRGGGQTGTAQIEASVPGGGGRVYQIIDYDYEINKCGVIKRQSVSVSEQPSGLLGTAPTPLLDITPPPAGGAAGATGYPAFPGTTRTP